MLSRPLEMLDPRRLRVLHLPTITYASALGFSHTTTCLDTEAPVSCSRTPAACPKRGRHPVRGLLASAGAVRMAQIVSAGELLGDDHAPSVDDELAGLVRVQGSEVGVDPVEAHIRRRRH